MVDAALLADTSGRFLLDDVNAHHVLRVLRVRSGELITLTDGAGAWVTTVMEAAHSGAWLIQAGELQTTDVVRPFVEVGFALTKADKPEWVIQKLTELGVNSVAPLIAERSIVRWDSEKVAKNTARFRLIAREAVQQSRQTWLPTIHAPQSVSHFASVRVPGTLARCDRGGISIDVFFRAAVRTLVGDPPTVDGTEAPDANVSVIVGPEGGWSADEREWIPTSVGLAEPILRAETAAVVAGTLLVDSRNRWLTE